MEIYLDILHPRGDILKILLSHFTPQGRYLENPAIGIILCTDKDRLEVEYAIGNMNQPLGVATYSIEKKLPLELENILPTSDEMQHIFEDKENKNKLSLPFGLFIRKSGDALLVV